MRALLSVSDKNGIVEFAKELVSLGYEIVSTGGTYKTIRNSGVNVMEVTEVTKFPECFDGRVKTLNPYIHGGILHRRDKEEDVQTARNLEIEAIDLVCVNLYPFKETIEKTDNFDEIIENIDIGGPSMVRAAAKNFNDVIVVTDAKDYELVINNIKNKTNTIEFRKDMMIKAFEHTAAYDVMIANYMNKRFNNSLGEKAFVSGTKVVETRYGENPHQNGALYEFDSYFSDNFKTLKGEPSFNNLTDINGAVKLASNFGTAKAVAIVKHANPCGFALKDTLLQSYTEALKCDPISAYGGVVAINGTLDKELATKINEIFVEVIVAANVDDDALEVFASKKRIKIFTLGNEYLSSARDAIDFKHIDGGFVYQDSDTVKDEEIQNAKCETIKKATASEMKDLEVAYKIAALTKSNCVVYVKNSAMVGIGMGMTSRVDAAKCAIHKADQSGLSLQGSALASEAFFPFRDSVDAAAAAGVKNIIQPGGSMRDSEVIEACNENGLSMYLTGVRHFLH